MGHLGDSGTCRTALSLAWDVALLASNRQREPMGQANLVPYFTSRFLLGKLCVLLSRIPSPSISESKSRGIDHDVSQNPDYRLAVRLWKHSPTGAIPETGGQDSLPGRDSALSPSPRRGFRCLLHRPPLRTGYEARLIR
jgi:hypothetical protein